MTERLLFKGKVSPKESFHGGPSSFVLGFCSNATELSILRKELEEHNVVLMMHRRMEESHIPGSIWASLLVDPVTLIRVITPILRATKGWNRMHV